MSLLYKYIHLGDQRNKGISLPLLVLQSLRLRATDPKFFNDPFEVRPWFDQECHDHFANQHEQFHGELTGNKFSLLAGQSMVGMPTENAGGFAEHLTKDFRDSLSRKYRVLCLSRNPKSVLMWGHYTNSYQGIVIGIDTEDRTFAKGLKPDGYQIEYSIDRERTRLPLAYFSSPRIELMDFDRNILNDPNSNVPSYGGLTLRFHQYRKLLEDAELTALTTKAKDWQYEQEVRFIYDVTGTRSKITGADGSAIELPQSIQVEGGSYYVHIPPKALKEIIIGREASLDLVQNIVRLFRSGKIGQPKLFYTSCHPFLYEVQLHETNDDYLLKYFEIIRPTL